MKESPFDSLFKTLSKLTIFIPIIVVIAALIIKFSPDVNTNDSKTVNVKEVKNQDVFRPIESSAEAKFDLNGSYQCQFITKEASLSAKIDNNRVYADIVRKTSNDLILINGDCLYHWQKGQYSGEKMCNFKQVMSFAQVFLGINSASMIKEALPSGANIEEACQKKEIDESAFIIPKNINFKEISLNDLQELGSEIMGK